MCAILALKPGLLKGLRSMLRNIGIERTFSGPLQLVYHALYRKDPLEITFLLYADECPLAEADYKFRPSDNDSDPSDSDTPYRTSEEYLVLYSLLSLMKEVEQGSGESDEGNPLSGAGTLKLVHVPDKDDPKISDFRLVSRDEYLQKADRSVIGTDDELRRITKKLKDFFRLESERLAHNANEHKNARLKLDAIPKYVISDGSVTAPPSSSRQVQRPSDKYIVNS